MFGIHEIMLAHKYLPGGKRESLAALCWRMGHGAHRAGEHLARVGGRQAGIPVQCLLQRPPPVLSERTALTPGSGGNLMSRATLRQGGREEEKQQKIAFSALSCCSELGFPGGARGKEPAYHCRRHKRRRFEPWGWEDPLEEGMATHSSILAWGTPWTEEPGRLHTVHRVAKSWTRLKWLSTHI